MKKAQSILEYVIMVTVIVAGIVIASDYLKDKVQKGTENAADSIENSLSGNPSLGGGDGGTDPGNGDIPPGGGGNPTDPKNPPGPTTPVPIGTLPQLDLSVKGADDLIGDISVLLPGSYPPLTAGQERLLAKYGIIVGGTGAGSATEQSTTGYVTWAQRNLITKLINKEIPAVPPSGYI